MKPLRVDPPVAEPVPPAGRAFPVPFAGPVESADALHEITDRAYHAAIASMTLGISPISLLQAWQDWALHLAISPGKQQQLLEKLVRKQIRLARYIAACAVAGKAAPCCIEPLPQDRRFAGDAWKALPFSLYAQSFLLAQQWWHNATTGVSGVSARHERLVAFYARQLLDTVSPGNFAFSNPDVIAATLREGGANFLRGLGFMAADAMQAVGAAEPDHGFEPGRDVAVTPGAVVYRNELIELIQYAPATEKAAAQPLLIVPAWIMKYYILDLSPENSLIRYLVGQGFTVFSISWINPDARHRDFGLEDYVRLGVMAALDAVERITGAERVHAAGYCLGGTLLSMASAAMARDGDTRLATQTMLAAQVDFEEPGELGLFIDESQLAFLEDAMWQKGYLDQWQMAGAFQMLRSQDLVWSRIVRDYMLGQRRGASDLMAWNADATRMPFRMHSEYLKGLYLDNDLSRGRFRVGGREVHVEDIRVPVFAVGTVADHVAPWQSVFKLVHLFDTDVDFVLTSGGHNAGIVSEPGHPRRTYRTLAYRHGDPHPDAEEWARHAEPSEGSWWPVWTAWLKARSSGEVDARPPGNEASGHPVLGPAPGTYVLMK